MAPVMLALGVGRANTGRISHAAGWVPEQNHPVRKKEGGTTPAAGPRIHQEQGVAQVSSRLDHPCRGISNQPRDLGRATLALEGSISFSSYVKVIKQENVGFYPALNTL